MSFNKKNILILVTISCLLIFPHFTHAAGLVPCGGDGEPRCNIYHVFYIIATLTNWLISVAGLYAVYKIANAGFWLVLSGDSDESVTKWRKGITGAVVGMVMVFMAFLIVNTAVNLLLMSKCKLDLKNPLNYVRPINPNSSSCEANPIPKTYN